MRQERCRDSGEGRRLPPPRSVRPTPCRARGLIAVEQRPQRGAPNLVNIVRIICADWLDWLKGRRGCKKVRLTGNRFSEEGKKEGWSRALRPVLEGFQRSEHPPPRRY